MLFFSGLPPGDCMSSSPRSWQMRCCGGVSGCRSTVPWRKGLLARTGGGAGGPQCRRFRHPDARLHRMGQRCVPRLAQLAPGASCTMSYNPQPTCLALRNGPATWCRCSAARAPLAWSARPTDGYAICLTGTRAGWSSRTTSPCTVASKRKATKAWQYTISRGSDSYAKWRTICIRTAAYRVGRPCLGPCPRARRTSRPPLSSTPCPEGSFAWSYCKENGISTGPSCPDGAPTESSRPGFFAKIFGRM